MAPRLHILVCAISTLCLIGVVVSDDPDFPTLEDIEIAAYTTEVQVTDQVTQDTAYARELYDFIEDAGKLYLIIEGAINQVYYYNDTNEILEVNSTRCMVWKTDESDYGLTDVFYGWRSLKPLVIGPSALLFYAQTRRDDIKYNGTTTIRDIPGCDTYYLSITNKEEKINIFYYFAPADWTTPYQVKGLRVPIRIHVVGQSSKDVADAQWADIDIINDFAYFKPTIDRPSELQPKLGLGCMLRTKTDTFPDIPKTFKYSAELVDLVEASEHDEFDVKFMRLWYDQERRIARFDIYLKTKSLKSFQDYNTGVMFNFANGMGCETAPMVNAYFEAYDEDWEGRFKTSKEILHLDGEFYEMGQRQIRGLTCDVYESVEYDYFYENQIFHRFVVTAYFVEDFVKIGVDSNEESRIPVQIMLTGWKSATEMAFQKQYNILAFSDSIYPEMYENLELDKCFKATNSKSYFVLLIETSSDSAAQMEFQNDLIVAELKAQIVKYADIPDWRIPFFKIDFKPSGVLGTGLILDRPPPLMQFEWFGKTDHKTKDKGLRIADASTESDCADACIDAEVCTGFYICNEGCFLKSEDLSVKHNEDEDTWDLGICDEYIRDQKGTTNEHNTPLKKALQKLETAVLNQNISVLFQVTDGVAIIKVAQILIGDGPYTGFEGADKPYDVNVKFRRLDPGLETSKIYTDVDFLHGCFKKCQALGSECASFSFCGRSKSGKKKPDQPKCVVSSELVVQGKYNDKDLVQDEDCDIYDLKFLEYFDKYPGQVTFLPGYLVIDYVESAEECAKKCRFDGKTETSDKQKCRGFEYCKSRRMCTLHEKHILDLKPGETGSVKDNACVHYAARFIADYANMGRTLVDDTSNVRYQVSLEDCARICSEELRESCKSFNYCPEDGSSCQLSGKVIATSDSIFKEGCTHYEKKVGIQEWTNTKEKSLSKDGYTKKGFTGLVIGMLALGLIIGALSFVGYSYIRSRQYGEGMSVRFMKQDNA